MRAALLLVLLLSCLASGVHLKSVRVAGNRHLPEKAVVDLSGLVAGSPADSASLARAERALLASGYFQAVAFDRRLRDDTLVLEIRVTEAERTEYSVYGGALSFTMFNEDKFWFAVTPGVKKRFLFGRPHSLRLTATFPYTYGVSADYDASGFPHRTLRSGLSLSARAFPSYYAPYYGRQAAMEAMTEREILDRLTLRFSVNEEIGTTWRIDTRRWRGLDWQVIIDPDDVRDTLFDAVYPRREQAPSAALSARLDRRDSPMYPTRGFYTFAEGRRFWVQNLKTDDVYAFNQVSGGIKAYAPVTGRQTFSAAFSAAARDRFDVRHLSHRMIFYDDDWQFRGFTSLASTDLLFLNLEYRLRFFDFRYDDFASDLALSPEREKMARRLDYTAELFLYADNGLLWGHIFTDVYERKSFFDLDLEEDLFTGAGVGGRLAYPRLGYVAAGGLTLYRHKKGLDQSYMPLIFTSLTGSF